MNFLHHEKLTDISLHDFCFYNDKGTKRNVLLYRDYLLKSKDVSARTVNNQITLICSLFSELVQREIAEFNPASSIVKLKVKDGRNFAFSADEKRKLINYIQEHDKELYVFVNFLYYTYIRPDELRFLRVKDLRTNQLYIDSGISKNNNSEFAMIPEHLEELIEKYEIRKRHGDSFLFFSVKKGLQVPRSENYFYQKHRAILNLLEIDKRCTMYSWKHTGVCDAHDANIPIDYLRQQLRHKDLTTTQKYLKSLGKNLNMTIIKRFPKL
ncbi:MAG: site-specific integrase [Arcicella sp.]|jgi:integrase|nr:site-specific integrase [Arcicella sp.]